LKFQGVYFQIQCKRNEGALNLSISFIVSTYSFAHSHVYQKNSFDYTVAENPKSALDGNYLYCCTVHLVDSLNIT